MVRGSRITMAFGYRARFKSQLNHLLQDLGQIITNISFVIFKMGIISPFINGMEGLSKTYLMKRVCYISGM